MKVSKQQVVENRESIVRVAAAQLREQGFSQMNVADVAKAAGLTHGALYRHFKSKEALQAAAIEQAFEESMASFSDLRPEAFLARYLSTDHRDNAAYGCPTAALLSEVRWQSDASRTAFSDGVTRFAALVRNSLERDDADGSRGLAMLAFAAMAGGMAISRAMRGIDDDASDGILRTVADQLRRLGVGESRQGRPAIIRRAKRPTKDKS